MTSMNRILVGYDGSAGADEAVGLVTSLRLPSDTVVRVITAVPTERELRSAWGRLIVGEASDLVRELSIQAEQALDPVRQRLSDAEPTTDTAVVLGRPPQVLVEEARRSRATLIAIGSRGLGPIASTLVGSVSAEVVDNAPCPVLVARSRLIRKDPVRDRRITACRSCRAGPGVASHRAAGAGPGCERRPGDPSLGGRHRADGA